MSKKDKDIPLKFDLACGNNKQEGFKGIDIVKLPGVDIVHDLLRFPWPFKKESVSEFHCSHYLEHVPGKLRFRFMDEVYRVLVPEGKIVLICPYARSSRATQDSTHEWPPISEESFLYFNKAWRVQNKLEHYAISCDFDFAYGYAMVPEWAARSEEARNFAIKHYWNVVMDLQITLTKRETKP